MDRSLALDGSPGIRTYNRDSLGFFFFVPDSEYACHEIVTSFSTPRQSTLHSNRCNDSAIKISHYYYNFFTNYFTTEMGMRRISEEIMKTLKLYHLSRYHFF